MSSNTCSRCGKELKNSIEEYGDIVEPVCWSCFTDPDTAKEERIQKMQDRIMEINEEIRGGQAELERLQEEMSDVENTIKDLGREEDELHRKILDEQMGHEQKLTAWKRSCEVAG